MKQVCLLLIIYASPVVALSQLYTKEKNRYTFAQTTFGYNMDFSPPSGYSYQTVNGNLERFKLNSNFTPIITITGLHFWGHVEFFTGFALPSTDLKSNSSYSFSRSAGTGFKVFPFQIREGTIRPFAGTSISSFSYQHQNAIKYRRLEFPLMFGLTYSFKHGLVEFGVNYYTTKEQNYYLNKNETVKLGVPPLCLSIDYKYFFDLSNGSSKRDLSGENKALYERLKKTKRLSSLSIVAGPAYAFFTGSSSYNKINRPYLDDYKLSSIFPDLGIGYYSFKTDATVNLSYRFYKTRLSSFDVQQSVMRKSVALEAFKFFGDYHGFVPFTGLILSRELIQVKEVESGVTVVHNTRNFWSPGIIVGWDVRPTNVDWWGVRTNIRYFPFLQVDMPGNHQIDFQQIEVNFLQLVLYPSRLRGTFFSGNQQKS